MVYYIKICKVKVRDSLKEIIFHNYVYLLNEARKEWNKMDIKPMRILVVEDDLEECNRIIECAKQRKDIEIVAITDSDIDAIKHVKSKNPEGIMLDLELNNSKSGNTDSFGFLEDLKKLKCDPIIIVTTHVNSQRTYDILHRNGVELILYKEHPGYSPNQAFNKFINLRKMPTENVENSIENKFKSEDEKISDCINNELDLVGITANLKGRQYIHDAILFLIKNENSDESVIQYLSKIHKKSSSTITNGIQNAIIHGWRISAVEDLEKYYTAKVNYNTGLPTPMELVYYYVSKVKKMV